MRQKKRKRIWCVCGGGGVTVVDCELVEDDIIIIPLLLHRK